MIELFQHQEDAIADVDRLHLTADNILCVLATGSGKTFVQAYFAERYYQAGEPTWVIAHRDVLLGQLSRALCVFGVPHSFIAAQKTVTDITNINYKKYGNHFHDVRSPIVVVSVATLAARIRDGKLQPKYLESIKHWLLDEAHHLTAGSQWGKVVEAIPNATGIGFTATPIRGDRKGLGRHAHGYFDAMSDVTSMIELVKLGRLTRMKVYAPDFLDTAGVNITSGGDFNQKQLAEITRKNTKIIGSSIEYYKQHIYGQPAITFAVNIEHGKDVARKWNEAGIPTAFVSSKSPESERKKAVDDLRTGKLWNLVNVDLFGEGFDAPAVAGIFMLRKTESYSLFKQQIGRCLRNSDGKIYGYVFDHVGNVNRMLEKYHLPTPYHDPKWTLDAYGKVSDNGDDGDDDLPDYMKCPECAIDAPIYDWFDETGELIAPGFKHDQDDENYTCPDCKHVFNDEETEAVVRKVQEANGKLFELSFDDQLEFLRIRDEEVFKPVEKLNLHSSYADAQMSRHVDRQNAVVVLQRKINTWCNNLFKQTGWSSELIRREFEVQFNVNIYQAQTLSAPKATKLAQEIQKHDAAQSRTRRKA